MTCIHVGALVKISHYWIYEIGHSLIGISEPEERVKYFSWAKEPLIYSTKPGHSVSPRRLR